MAEKQNDGFLNNNKIGGELKEGLKAQNGPKKFFKKIIAMKVVMILLKGVAIILAMSLLLTSISNFVDEFKGKKSKDAMSSAVDYSSTATSNSSPNRIIVDAKYVNENGAYVLDYEFKDDNGNTYTEEEALKNIKKDLLEENSDLDIDKFSESELKVIGVLMYNGLKVEKYNEEELKALVIFIKADIASQSFDLRNNDQKNEEIKFEELSKNDEVYGTLEIHKTTIETDESGNETYKEIKLEYVPYGNEFTRDTFCYMAKQGNEEVLNKFSLNEEGKLVIAKWSSNSTTYTYLDKAGNMLSQENIEKIGEEGKTDDNEFNIDEYPLPVDYKSYIKKYIINYGFLSDLLVTTDNVDFCLDIAKLAFNNKIVLNLKEELTTTYKKEKIQYTKTTLLYDYIKYEVAGNEENSTDTLELVTSGSGSPNNSSILTNNYGWSSSFEPTQTTGEYGKTDIYNWTHSDGTRYQLKHVNISSYQNWTLYKKVENTTQRKLDLEENNSGNYLINLYGNRITEVYDEYTIDEPYTAKEEITYILVEETINKTNKYDLDISEIDCWYLKYKKEYQEPTSEQKQMPTPTGSEGKFKQEKETLQEPTTDESIISNDANVNAFVKAKEAEYTDEYSNVECKVTELKIDKREKVSTEILEYNSVRTIYSFGEEDADTTLTHFKNLEYVGDTPSYTATNEEGDIEVGFLYIYDKYIKEDKDLFLEQDAEKRLFELLEDDEDTSAISEIMKFLLYVYDGIDRGVTDYDKNFKVIDINLTSKYGISPFGCNISKQEFIEAAQAQGETILSGLAEEFYDICTSPEYNVNPALAYAWAAIESGYGAHAPYNNLFGMGIGNGMSSGEEYDTYADSIRGYCEWVVNAADMSSNSYSWTYARAQEFSTVNDVFKGRPETNIYALFCTYAYLGDTHIADEPDFSNPAGLDYYIKNGSTWGAGGRIQIYYMYECGGLYEGEYEIRCGHPNGSDPTTLQEQADYAEYSTKTRVDLAKKIFGNNVFVYYGGANVAEDILNAAEEVHTMYEEEQWTYYTDCDSTEGEGAGLKKLLGCTMEGSFTNPHRVTCCATFVSQVLYKAGIITEEQFTDNSNNKKYSFHSPFGVHGILTEYQGENLQEITDADALQAGDIVFMGDNNATDWNWDHVQIYAGNNTWYNAGSTGAIRKDSPYYDANWDRGYWIALRLLGSSGKYEELNDGYRAGIYTSRSGRKYTEWIQGAGDVAGLPMFDKKENGEYYTMGEYGCNVYACATLVSSTGIEPHIRDAYYTYKDCGNNANKETAQTLLDDNGIDATVYSVEDYEHFVSILSNGRGVAIHAGSGYNNLYTENMHWIVVADIRETQLDSEMGYDIYVLTSGGANDRGHGWQKIETVANNLKSPWEDGYYISD